MLALCNSGVAKLGHTGARALATRGRAPPTAGALAIIGAESAVVDRDRALKIHKGLESSSADTYLYRQKSCAVRPGEHTRLG